MNRLKLYRRLRGGVWVKYFDKLPSQSNYWRRYKTVEEAYTIGAFMHEPICFEVYGVLSYKDVQSTIYISKQVDKKSSVDDISDGYHTFDELYLHRNRLFIALLHIFKEGQFREAWKTKLSADGFEQGDWFIAGLGPGYISYHLPMELWDDLDVKEIPRSLWDGHNHYDVAKRLKGIEQIGSYRIEHVDSFIPRRFHFWDGTIIMRKKGKIKLPEWKDKYLCFIGGINKFDEIEMGELTMFEDGQKVALRFDDKELLEAQKRTDWEQTY